MNRSSRHRLVAVSGFSLVEVLVALVVLSVGMLGIAALYVESLRSGRTALFRTQAVTLASDIADRIRANPTGKAAYAEESVTSDDTNSACAPGGAGCTVDALAKHDKATWLGSLESALPEGTGTITFDNTTNPSTYIITVSWAEPGQADASTYTVGFQV